MMTRRYSLPPEVCEGEPNDLGNGLARESLAPVGQTKPISDICRFSVSHAEAQATNALPVHFQSKATNALCF